MNTNSLWLLDIGNSSITVARRKSGRIAIEHEFFDDSIPKIVSFLNKSGGNIEKLAILCSVVPKVEKNILSALRHYKSFYTLRLGKDIPILIKSNYLNNNRLGTDRKVNVYGALKISKPPFLVLDFGTATTIEFVSKQGVFEGGMILPGIKSCLDLLHEKTALLPVVRIKPVRYFLGRDTKSGMLSGVLYGYGAMIKGLVGEFKQRYGKGLKTIGTGGLVDIVSRYCGGFDYKDRLLTLRSMSWIYEDWLKNKNLRPKRKLKIRA